MSELGADPLLCLTHARGHEGVIPLPPWIHSKKQLYDNTLVTSERRYNMCLSESLFIDHIVLQKIFASANKGIDTLSDTYTLYIIPFVCK